ncbi:MAG: hypothetical protein ACK45R_11760, partial [Candidatus Kapaibacterium sp.]
MNFFHRRVTTKSYPHTGARLLLSTVVAFVCATAIHAQPRVAVDELRRALRDEINRSMSELRLPGVAAPYYVEYTLKLRRSYTAKASMGALVTTSSSF